MGLRTMIWACLRGCDDWRGERIDGIDGQQAKEFQAGADHHEVALLNLFDFG